MRYGLAGMLRPSGGSRLVDGLYLAGAQHPASVLYRSLLALPSFAVLHIIGRDRHAIGKFMMRQKLQERLHHEIALEQERMRQGEHLKIGNVALIVKDIEIARARAVLLRAHTPQAVLDRLEVGEQFLRGQARCA